MSLGQCVRLDQLTVKSHLNLAFNVKISLKCNPCVGVWKWKGYAARGDIYVKVNTVASIYVTQIPCDSHTLPVLENFVPIVLYCILLPKPGPNGLINLHQIELTDFDFQHAEYFDDMLLSGWLVYHSNQRGDFNPTGIDYEWHRCWELLHK